MPIYIHSAAQRRFPRVMYGNEILFSRLKPNRSAVCVAVSPNSPSAPRDLLHHYGRKTKPTIIIRALFLSWETDFAAARLTIRRVVVDTGGLFTQIAMGF